MITTTGLTRIYGKGENAVTAINNLDIRIDDGELVAITGKSGSGKTTLLNILGGLDKATGGSVCYDDTDITKLGDTYDKYENGTLENKKGFCAVVSTEEIAKQGYILTPGRYVGIEEKEDDGEPFDDKMKRLTSELSDLFEQSHTLEAEIRKQLKGIGYNIK